MRERYMVGEWSPAGFATKMEARSQSGDTKCELAVEIDSRVVLRSRRRRRGNSRNTKEIQQ